jgi:signal transduction histidine kinase
MVAIVAVTLTIVSGLILNRLDDYLREQQTEDLQARASQVALYAQGVAENVAGFGPVVGTNGFTDIRVINTLATPFHRDFMANILGRADVVIQFERLLDQDTFIPSRNGRLEATLDEPPGDRQSRESLSVRSRLLVNDVIPYSVEVTLANPYTSRASTIATATSLLTIIGFVALGLAVIAATLLARRFTSPLRRLTEASRALAEGDLSSRVPLPEVGGAATELVRLATQFNTMASRLEQSVAIIRHDRDRSRDFLADVSHELRTPIAAMRTFNELLVEGAAADPEARAEFLEASRVQLERLDWLAQNLLELSKLDSGLVLLDLRPDDLRGTVEQAVDSAAPAARRRGVVLDNRFPSDPLRVHHDTQRVGQAVSNLVANAIKFTPRNGRVSVSVEPYRDGARIEVADTGVGIDATELPRIFDRFYRGSRANEARGSGSGLGLAIVKSIVDMHGGSITVESRIGTGTRFTITLPRDPRLVDAPGAPRDAGPVRIVPAPAAAPGPTHAATEAVAGPAVASATDGVAAGQAGGARSIASVPTADVADSSPSVGSRMNPGPAR